MWISPDRSGMHGLSRIYSWKFELSLPLWVLKQNLHFFSSRISTRVSFMLFYWEGIPGVFNILYICWNMHDNLRRFIRARANIVEMQGMGQHTGRHRYQSVMLNHIQRTQAPIKMPGRLYRSTRGDPEMHNGFCETSETERLSCDVSYSPLYALMT